MTENLAMSNKRHLLVIEDNRDLAELLALNLRGQDYEVDLAFDGLTGASMSGSREYTLIVLDVMLPGLDGIGVCQQIRQQKRYTPILMLTSRSAEVDRIRGLEVGADDYVVKPFSILELLARIKAILRRMDAFTETANVIDSSVIKHKEMTIDLDKRHVLINANNIDLTAREFDLLAHFARHPGRVFSRKQLLDQVWGYAYEGYEHTVNSHINRLRVKIEKDPTSPEYIETVWGVGYRYAE